MCVALRPEAHLRARHSDRPRKRGAGSGFDRPLASSAPPSRAARRRRTADRLRYGHGTSNLAVVAGRIALHLVSHIDQAFPRALQERHPVS